MKSASILTVLVMAVPAFGAGRFDVRAFGARGDGTTKDTAAIQQALDRCSAAGGGEVVVPAGTYLVGSLELKSSTTLRVEEGATLMGSPDLEDYPIVKARWEGRWVDAHRALISARDASHIAVLGPGTIAGNPALGGRQMPRRPCVVEPIHCTDVRLEGFHATQRRMWTTHPTLCDNVVVRNLTIRSIGGNSDGVDVDSCRHVLIEGCDIQSGDDCIAIKSGRGMEGFREAHPTEDVVIRDCTLADDIFACIGIGSETSGGIRGVRIERCRFTQAKTFAIYIKSRPGRGAFIEDITARDLDVRTAPGGFLRVNLLSSGLRDPEPVPGDEGIPTARRFSFSNITVNCGTLVDAVAVSPSKPVEGFSLSDIHGTCTRGIALANLAQVELRDIQVTGYAGALLTTDNVTGTGLEGASEPADRTSLWNGRDLSGWKVFLGDAGIDPASVWKARDGVLRLGGRMRGYVETEESFANYRLHLEWRWAARRADEGRAEEGEAADGAVRGGNSGVLVHVTGADAIWPQSLECQLQAGDAGTVIGLGVDLVTAGPGESRRRAPRRGEAVEKPAGEWNSCDLYAHGDFLEVFVNGVRQDRVERLPLTRGRIALQMEGSPIEFRHLWLQSF